jgi:hypothetical protein
MQSPLAADGVGLRPSPGAVRRRCVPPLSAPSGQRAVTQKQGHLRSRPQSRAVAADELDKAEHRSDQEHLKTSPSMVTAAAATRPAGRGTGSLRTIAGTPHCGQFGMRVRLADTVIPHGSEARRPAAREQAAHTTTAMPATQGEQVPGGAFVPIAAAGTPGRPPPDRRERLAAVQPTPSGHPPRLRTPSPVCEDAAPRRAPTIGHCSRRPATGSIRGAHQDHTGDHEAEHHEHLMGGKAQTPEREVRDHGRCLTRSFPR